LHSGGIADIKRPQYTKYWFLLDFSAIQDGTKSQFSYEKEFATTFRKTMFEIKLISYTFLISYYKENAENFPSVSLNTAITCDVTSISAAPLC
jgi:hypothetical protein